jgi:hypothetical protein
MDEPVKPYSRRLHHALILAALLAGIDAFVMNQGVIKSDDGAHLYYVAIPPFGRRMYDFARNQWTYLD